MTGGKVKWGAADSTSTAQTSVSPYHSANDGPVKYKIEQYTKQLGKFKSFTPIIPGWYLETFLDNEMAPAMGGFPYVLDDEGYLTLKLPK